jgi:hypothetical protein
MVRCSLYHPALRRCEMESTCETRDLPVLDAIVRVTRVIVEAIEHRADVYRKR